MNIEIPDDFKDQEHSQVIICIQGTPEGIRDQLRRIVEDAIARKPIQGMYIGANSETYIRTPVWDGKKY